MTIRLMRSLYAACTFLLFTLAATAQQREEVSLPSLQAPVEVLRDQWGVNHIYATNQHDLFFTQGYCAARDRLFQFELWRRQATGTVAELLGPAEVKRDIGTRLFRFRGDLTKELAHYHRDGVDIITAYTNGVNVYIAEVLNDPSKLPMEFKLLGIKPGKWTPDIVISRHGGLKGNLTDELSYGRAVAKAGADKVKELAWFHPKEPDLRLDTSITSAMLSKNILDLYNAMHRPITFRKEDAATAATHSNPVMERDLDGSNNWIVSGRKTASGYPILANDPHRSIALPSLRYMVHLVAPGWNVIGAGEPTIPGVSIGHNEHGAWGLTIFETDGEDLYVYDLNPQNLAQYRYKNAWVTMQEEKETIAVKGSNNIEATLRYTVHGPVVYIDSAARKGYAVKCAWLERGGAPYLASLRMNQARNWKEFREACRYSNLPGENMIWADRKGNIGWQVVGITPIRKNFSGMVPVPGDGRYEWAGYIDIKKRPNKYNPKEGFVATANEHVTPGNYRHWNTIGYTWADPFRGARIREVLSGDESITLEETKALQTDYFSIPARTLVPMLKGVTLSSDLSHKAYAALEGWNYELDKTSVAAGIYANWERKLSSEANTRLVPADLRGLVRIQLQKLITWLQEPAQRFGTPEERDAFLASTFEQAVKELSTKFGPDPFKWAFGQSAYKHTALTHPLNALLPDSLKEKYNLGPLPRGGNSHTPNATGSTDRQAHGASFRLITDVSDWDKTLMINSPGQSADPKSKYYNNLYELWANDGYFPAYFSRPKIEGSTDSRLMLKPQRN
jgi:penicillin G amidase